MESTTESATTHEAMREGPRFGLATATFVVVSSMIGTGVLTTSGFTVFFVGSNQLMLLMWVVGGVLAVCGALTLCELTAALPRSGAITSSSARHTVRWRRSCRAGSRS